ncbi:hypothetical protein [Maridesulfovibrio sp.]|uniref:VgrG-related protein n=1 Tax=Maridesulfovibrio sp. TaxID=2795000 RepID=UPI002A1889E2|nr:hypothetical protein [Maridesulfovibrio sp.]
MSSVSNDVSAILRMLGTGPSGGPSGVSGKGSSTAGAAAVKGEQQMFDMEMSMANKLLSGSSDDEGFPSSDMDMGVMNNLLVLEALSALNSVKGINPSGSLARLRNNPYPAPQSVTHESPVKKMSANDVTGSLSAKFESGNKGAAAIGYDRVGGTSYGKYQIASNTGTMDRFISFLKEKAPEIADKLSGAGPANTGSKSGLMPDVWKKIAFADPAGFEKLQHDFIQKSHYDPAVKMIFEMTGVDMNSLPGPVREVLWSTSVQHGPTGASQLISRAIDKLAAGAESKGFPADLVKEIYGERTGQFSSSTSAVRQSVDNRLKQERNMVLAMLGESVSRTA